MRMAFCVLTIFLLLFAVPIGDVYAHPGSVASDGCHYCRTNCDRWGVGWNVRHCHTSQRTSTTNKISASNTVDSENEDNSLVWLLSGAGLGGGVIYMLTKKS